MIENIKKYPDISCDIEPQIDKNQQDSYINKLQIEQSEKDLVIFETIFDPSEKKENTVKTTGKIIAFNSFIQIAKISLDNNTIRWFDYQKKTFDTSRIENYLYFKTTNFKPDRAGLNMLIKVFNIALSLTSLENYAFSFWENADIQDNITIYKSNLIKGFGVKANIYLKVLILKSLKCH
ncbi:MAG: hypothetical protein JXR68_01475 [Bacteroidales bacterium]|nr:hypothetical protein [Bacteroidales bacterium]